MQEKRNKIQIAVLIVLLTLTFFFYWKSNSNNVFEIDKDIFKVDNFKEINHIILESPGKKVELELNGRWRVNGQYDADPNMISLLFATLQEATPKRPVATALRDSLGTVLDNQSVKVSLYEGESLQKEFFAGGNRQKTEAYFKLTGSNTPYIIVIPGYRDYVSRIFELDESGWRDKYVFGFNWRNFKSLEAEFPGNPDQDFFVGMNEENYFSIRGLPQTDTSKLNDFLDKVSLLATDLYLPQSQSDSMKTLNPEMTITVSDAAGQQHTLTLYSLKSSPVPGLINSVQPVVFDRRKIAAILRPRSYFTPTNR